MKVLLLLAQRAGEVVSRDELIDRCWDGRIVGEDVINRAILLLRGTSARLGGFRIETLRKSGYRLIVGEPKPSSEPGLHWGLFALLLASLVGLLLIWDQSRQAGLQTVTIELVPFDASGDRLAVETAEASNETVADMLADSGITVLRPRAEAVGGPTADFRLAGQVRAIGGRLQATLQLDDLRHGTLLLSRRFEADQAEAGNLPGRMGAFAATSLASTGALMVLDGREPADPRLLGELLRYLSMLVVHEDSLRTYQAVDRLAAAMPESAIAQLGLAMSTPHALTLLPLEARAAALARGRQAGRLAHRLAPDFGDTYWPACMLYPVTRYAQCEESGRKGVEVDADSPFAAASLRNLLQSVGRYREALLYDRMSVAAMPYMGGRLAVSVMLLETMGQRDRAERQFQATVAWWPGFEPVYVFRLEGMLNRGDLAAAARFGSTIPPSIESVDRDGLRMLNAAVDAEDRKVVGIACSGRSPHDRLSLACVLALTKIGDHDGAFALLGPMFPPQVGRSPEEEDRMFLAHVGTIRPAILSAPALAPLRSDPRFLTLANRIGLTAYWRDHHLPDFCTYGREPVCAAIAGARNAPPA